MTALVTERPAVEGVHHVGHSTHCIVADGVAILTDPWVQDPADRVLVHAIPPAPLPADPDVVFISHSHGDHFDPAALSLVSRDCLVLVPSHRLAKRVREIGFTNVRAPRIGEAIGVGGVTITIGRGRHLVREIVCHIACAAGAVFFAGDSMLTKELEEFASRHPAELAILPAERSTIFGLRSVMTPEDSGALAGRLGARTVVLTHHESEVGTRHPLTWFVKLDVARTEELDDRWVIPAPGDHIPFPWSAETVS